MTPSRKPHFKIIPKIFPQRQYFTWSMEFPNGVFYFGKTMYDAHKAAGLTVPVKYRGPVSI